MKLPGVDPLRINASAKLDGPATVRQEARSSVVMADQTSLPASDVDQPTT